MHEYQELNALDRDYSLLNSMFYNDKYSPARNSYCSACITNDDQKGNSGTEMRLEADIQVPMIHTVRYNEQVLK